MGYKPWLEGERRRLNITFTPAEGEDPPDEPVTVSILKPDGTLGEENAEATKASGSETNFYLDYTADMPGTHIVYATSANSAPVQDDFEVEPNKTKTG